MTGSLQVKNNSFYMVINLYEDGKRKQRWIPTHLPVRGNKKKADIMLSETIAALEEEQASQAAVEAENQEESENSKDVMLFSDCILNWLTIAKRKVEPNTYESYVTIANSHLIPYFNGLGLSVKEVTLDVLQEFFDYEYAHGRNNGNGGVSPSYLRQFKNIIKQSLDEAVKKGIIASNPCQYVELPEKVKYAATVYSPEEIKRLFEAAKDDPMYNIIRITLLFGLRKSEALGLQWDAVDLDSNRLTIKRVVTRCTTVHEKNKTKSSSSHRSFALTPETREIFLEMKAKEEENARKFGSGYHHDPHIFKWDDGTPFSTDYVSKHFTILLQKNNLPHIRFHDLRHTCASLLLSNDGSLKDVQDYLGHSDIQMTANIYGHLSTSKKAALTNTITETLS